jgi:Na+-driven multidrug efflux pump
MTLDGMPYIGQYSDSTPYVYVSTGFNKWGMTNSLVAADIICDLICKKTNPYSDLFSPSRTVLHPQLAINAFESACMAGWTSYNKLDAFLLIPVTSISMASTTFVGQNFGAKKMARAKEGVKESLKLSVIITAALAVLMIVCKRPLLRLISPEADVIEFGAYFVTVISPFYIMICFNQIYAGALRGVGNANAPMVIMLGCFVLFRQAYLSITKYYFGQSLLLTALAYPAGWVLCSLLLAICYRRSKLFKSQEISV